MKTEHATIGVILPVKNCLELTREMLATICTSAAYRLYVIDDHSDRPVKEWLAARADMTVFFDPPHSTGVAYNWNLGMAAALGDGCTHLLVVNNDILFHPRTIDLMVRRIDRGDVALVSAHDVGGTYRDPAAVFGLETSIEGEDDRPEFPCFMLTEATLRSIGWFDEGFARAYFEDNDYCARIAMAGLRGIRMLNAPVFHYGSATVKTHQAMLPEVLRTSDANREYFRRKWGSLPVNSEPEMRACYTPHPFNHPLPGDAADQRVGELYHRALQTPSDVRGHLDYLYRLGSVVREVTELMPGGGQSTCAFLNARPERLTVYHPAGSAHLTLVEAAARLAGIPMCRHYQPDVPESIEPTDLLFIDTGHTEAAMGDMLRRYAASVRRYLVVHDTVTFGEYGEIPGTRGVWPAIAEFMRATPGWALLHHAEHDHGLVVVERR